MFGLRRNLSKKRLCIAVGISGTIIVTLAVVIGYFVSSNDCKVGTSTYIILKMFDRFLSDRIYGKISKRVYIETGLYRNGLISKRVYIESFINRKFFDINPFRYFPVVSKIFNSINQ